MILYTMMPQDVIYPIAEEEFSKQKIIEHNGVSLLVNETSPGEHYVMRVLSCNPQDFLNEQYSPGQKITLS